MSKEPLPIYSFQKMALWLNLPGFELVTLREAFSQARQNVHTAHRHDYFEIFWIEHGSGQLWIDFHQYPVAPNTFCFLSPGQMHHWVVPHPPDGYLVRFERDFYGADVVSQAQLSQLPVLYPLDDSPILTVAGEQVPSFQVLFDQMAKEYSSDWTDRATVLQAYLHILLIEAQRLLRKSPTAHTLEAASMLTRRFLLLIEAYYQREAAASWYADQLGVTLTQLATMVRKIIGKTPVEVIRDRKLLEAKRLLRYSDQSISEIAYSLNFEDPSYFGRFFKKHTQTSPGEFRQQTSDI